MEPEAGRLRMGRPSRSCAGASPPASGPVHWALGGCALKARAQGQGPEGLAPGCMTSQGGWVSGTTPPPLGRRVLNGGPGVSVLGGFRVLWQTQLSRRARSPHLRKVSDARPPCHFWFSKGPSRAHAAAGGTVPAEGGRPRRTAPPAGLAARFRLRSQARGRHAPAAWPGRWRTRSGSARGPRARGLCWHRPDRRPCVAVLVGNRRLCQAKPSRAGHSCV